MKKIASSRKVVCLGFFCALALAFGPVPLAAQSESQGESQGVAQSESQGAAQDLEPAGPPEYAPLVFSGKPGEYVYYRDTAAGGVSYIGLCIFGKNTLAVRLYEPETKNELVVLETFYTTGDKWTKGGLKAEEGNIDLVRGDFAKGGSPYVLAAVLEWADAWVKARPPYGDETGVPAEFRGGTDGGYLFATNVPVLQLREAAFAGSGREIRLVKTGMAETGSDPAFFGWTGGDD